MCFSCLQFPKLRCGTLDFFITFTNSWINFKATIWNFLRRQKFSKGLSSKMVLQQLQPDSLMEMAVQPNTIEIHREKIEKKKFSWWYQIPRISEQVQKGWITLSFTLAHAAIVLHCQVHCECPPQAAFLPLRHSLPFPRKFPRFLWDVADTRHLRWEFAICFWYSVPDCLVWGKKGETKWCLSVFNFLSQKYDLIS